MHQLHNLAVASHQVDSNLVVILNNQPINLRQVDTSNLERSFIIMSKHHLEVAESARFSEPESLVLRLALVELPSTML